MSKTTTKSRPPRRATHLSSVPYLPGLDGMRALAVVAVIIYHANSQWLAGGYLGVEVFFVISGYLITLLLMAETEKTGRIDMVGFWIRRARRLLPALFVMLAVVLVYTALFRADRLFEIRGNIIAGVAYVSNWFQIWVGQGYTSSGDFSPFRHLWSLAIEEQFYLIWPIVMLLALRRGTRKAASLAGWLFGGAILLTVVTAVFNYGGPVTDCEATPEAYWMVGEHCISIPDTLYLSTVTRAGGLLLGAGFALVWRPVAILRGPLRNVSRTLDVAAVIALGVLGGLHWWIAFNPATGVHWFLFRGGLLLTGIATLVVIAAVTHRYAAMGNLLGNPLFVWVGTRSYGLYLYHWPVFQVIREVTRPMTLNEFAVGMVITVALTEASYRYIETPIRKRQVSIWWNSLKRRRDPVPRQLSLGAAAVVLALLTYSGVALGTAEYVPNELEQSAQENDGSVTDLESMLEGGDDSATPTATTIVPVTVPGSSTTSSTTTTTTTTTLPSEPINFLAIGDSVMQGAANALAERGYTVDAEKNRQLADMVPLMEKFAENDLIGDFAFIHLGTNGPITNEQTGRLLDAFSDALAVVVFNNNANVPHTARNNEILREETAKRPNTILVDWQQLATECVGNCFAPDGYHLSTDGIPFYVKAVDCNFRATC